MPSWILSENTVLIILTVIGMAACSRATRETAARHEWTQPFSIAAYMLGALILVIVGATLFGIRLPLIGSTRTAIMIVFFLAVVKSALRQVHRTMA